MFDTGFELVKQNRFAKIYKRNRKRVPPKNFFGFVNHFMKNVKGFNPLLSANITKWANTQTICRQIADKLFKSVNCQHIV